MELLEKDPVASRLTNQVVELKPLHGNGLTIHSHDLSTSRRLKMPNAKQRYSLVHEI
jgi:hypothetical protein